VSRLSPKRQAPVYLSQSRLAEFLDVSRVTIWRWKRQGRLRTVKFSPSIERIHIDEVERLAQQSEHEQPSLHKRRKRVGARQQDTENAACCPSNAYRGPSDDPRDDPPQDDPPEEPD
jgi:hypothetical protein